MTPLVPGTIIPGAGCYVERTFHLFTTILGHAESRSHEQLYIKFDQKRTREESRVIKTIDSPRVSEVSGFASVVFMAGGTDKYQMSRDPFYHLLKQVLVVQMMMSSRVECRIVSVKIVA